MWFEERETQAAESWRIIFWYPRVSGFDHNRTLTMLCFIPSIGKLSRGNLAKYINVKDPVIQILGLNSIQVAQNQNFQLESLILAQNERWRQA